MYLLQNFFYEVPLIETNLAESVLSVRLWLVVHQHSLLISALLAHESLTPLALVLPNELALRRTRSGLFPPIGKLRLLVGGN